MTYRALATSLVMVLALAAGPAMAVEWTGQVVALYPEEQAFAIDAEGTLVELQVVPEATDELVTRYGQLKLGDTIRVEVNEEELLAMAIEILPSMTEPGQMEEPKNLEPVEPMEPKSESARGGY
jgi:hypothetical protein